MKRQSLANLTMYNLTKDQRVEIVKTHYQNGSILQKKIRALREFFGQHHRPNVSSIGRLVEKF